MNRIAIFNRPEMPEAGRATPLDGVFWTRAKRLFVTTGAQVTIQILGFLSGLVVMRLLPISEYAYYTIANAALGTMTVLSDSGISRSVLAQGGRDWLSRRALGGVVAAGLELRRRYAFVAIGVAVPIMFVMLKRQGASWLNATLIAAALMPLFVSSLGGQLLQIPMRLHQRLYALQTVQLCAAVMRLLLVVVSTSLFPVAWLTSLCAGLAQTWANRRFRRIAQELCDIDEPPNDDALAAIGRQLRRTAPGAVYYAFEGQITIWLIAVFGKTLAIAQVGALSRLTMGFNLIGTVFAILYEPRFARLRADQDILRRFWLTQLAVGAFLGAIVGGVALMPNTILAVLGRSYASLTHEVMLAAAGGALALMAGVAYVMSSARGTIVSPWISVPVSLLVQIALILLLPISTVSGVLWLGIWSNTALWFMQAINFTRTAGSGPLR